MHCKKCGAKIDDRANFCPNCGAKVGVDVFSQHSEKKKEKKSLYYSIEIIAGIFSIVFAALSFLGIYFVNLIGIALAAVTLSLVRKENGMGIKYSKLGHITASIGLSLAIIATILGAVSML